MESLGIGDRAGLHSPFLYSMAYEKEENYCTWSPDQIGKVRFNYGCYLHDRQYRNEVKNRKTRLEADQDLRDNIYKTFEIKGQQRRGLIISRLYYYAVRLFAWVCWVK